MRRAWIAVLAASIFSVPAVAQTTKPAPDLSRENAELRAYAEKLEARIADLEAKLKEQQKKSRPRADARPFTPAPAPAPYGYQLPHPPFKLPTPAVPAPP